MCDMKMLLMLIVGLGVAGVIAYFTLGQNQGMKANVDKSTTSAQDAADAYKANQAKMMKELGQ